MVGLNPRHRFFYCVGVPRTETDNADRAAKETQVAEGSDSDEDGDHPELEKWEGVGNEPGPG